MPFGIPSGDDWYVRFVGRKNHLFGVYRHHMKTISYLGQIDKALGVPATTRSWSCSKIVGGKADNERPSNRRGDVVRLAWAFGIGVLVAALAGCDSTARSVPMNMPAPSEISGGLVSRVTFVIRNQRHRVYRALSVSTRAGDCIHVENSTDVTIEASQVGPCGGIGVNINGGNGTYSNQTKWPAC